MRHPHPILYWIAFGSLLLIGALGAARFWHKQPADASLLKTILLTGLVLAAPLLSLIVVIALFGCMAIYLGTYRPGNRVQITGGEYPGSTAIVTQRNGMLSPGMMHVRLDGTDSEAQISPYHCRKSGWKSFLL